MIIFLILSWLAVPLYAQENNVDIIDDASQLDSQLDAEIDSELNFDTRLLSGDALEQQDNSATISNYIFGEVGYINAVTDFARRQSSFINVGVDAPWSWGRFYANYGGVEYKLTAEQELREGLTPNAERPKEIHIKLNVEDNDWRETFLQLNITSGMTLTVGRQRNSWGQFELFSPAALMQPLTANIISFIPSKVDLLHAQDQIKLAIFPNSKTEIQFYDMENIRTDKASDIGVAGILTPRELGAMIKGRPLAMGDEQKQHTQQKAVRLLFYPSWGTLGFTRHEGVNGLNPYLHAPVGQSEDGDVVASVFDNRDDSYLFYAKGKLSAIELAVPVNRLTWRFEHSIIETLDSPANTGNIALKTEESNRFTQSKIDEFINAVNDTSRGGQLTGTPLFTATRTLTGIGVTYNGPVWTSSINAFFIGPYKPTSHAGRRINAAYDALEEESEDKRENDFGQFPLISAYRFAGDENQHRYGYALGVLGVGFGVGALYSYNVTDDFSLAGSLGYVDISGFDFDEEYEVKRSRLPTVQASIRWQF